MSEHSNETGSTGMETSPLVLSLLAGLSTCLGACVVFFARKSSGKQEQSPLRDCHMAFSLALAGSVMVTVSFFSLLPESFSEESDSFTPLSIDSRVFWERVCSFLAGCGLYWLLSKCAFPEPDAILGLEENPPRDVEALLGHSRGEGDKGDSPSRKTRISSQVVRMRSSVVSDVDATGETVVVPLSAKEKDTNETSQSSTDVSFWSSLTTGADLESNEARRAWRVAMLLFVSLAVHNFPEGFAVAASSMHSPKLGLTTTVAIAFHNIPEGIAIAVPCLAARPDSPWLAFGLASLSGLAEPFGAAVALVVLGGLGDTQSPNSAMTTKGVLAFVSGIMVMVALNELLPEARRHSREGHIPMLSGIVVGAAIMIVSDYVLEG